MRCLLVLLLATALSASAVSSLRYNYGDGSYYVGSVDEESGKPNGKGKFYNTEGELEYEGAFLDGSPHGNGTWHGPDGSRLTGTFESGRANGHAVMRHPNGEKTEGEFKDNLPNGHVSMTRPGGERIEGQFKHGLPHGRVTWRTRDGNRMDGGFRMGKPHGYGKVVDKDGRVIYDGRFIGGKPVGKVPEGFDMEEFKYRH